MWRAAVSESLLLIEKLYRNAGFRNSAIVICIYHIAHSIFIGGKQFYGSNARVTIKLGNNTFNLAIVWATLIILGS